MSTHLRYGLPARDPQPARPRHRLLHRDGPPEELCLVQVPQLKAVPVVRVVVDVGQRRQAVPPGRVDARLSDNFMRVVLGERVRREP